MSALEQQKAKFKTIVSGYIRQETKRLKSSLSYHGIPRGIVEIVALFYGNGKDELDRVMIKIGMFGDSQSGKTQFMVKYACDVYDEDYIETLGVNFMEKTVALKNVNVALSIWDTSSTEFATLTPLVCCDAKVILFVFDLNNKQSLFSVKRWYKAARKESKVMIMFCYQLLYADLMYYV